MDSVAVEWQSEGSEKPGSAITYAQTMLFDTDIEKLKAKTGTTNITDALAIAAKHYLKCKGKNGACGCSGCRRHDAGSGECGLIRAVPRNPQFCEVALRR